MSQLHRTVARGLWRCKAAEDGFTIVFALALLTIGLAIGAAALAETLSSRSHANLDARARRALQAADYGVQAVLYRANQLNIDSLNLTGGKGVLGTLAVCIIPKIKEHTVVGWATVPVSASGACPWAEKEGPGGGYNPNWLEVGNHDWYQAEFVPSERVPTGGSGISFIEPKIIAIGMDDNHNSSVYARVEANLASVEPFKTLEANHDLTFKVPSATTFNGTARAAHNVIFKGEGPLVNTFTGTNLLGPGEKFIAAPLIEYGCKPEGVAPPAVAPRVVVTPGEEAMLQRVTEAGCEGSYFKRPSISVSSSKPSCPSSCESLPGYYEKRHAIFIKKEQTLELTPGKDYVFCSLVTNGKITLAAGTTNESLPVRIFIDNPNSSRCEGSQSEEGEVLEEGEKKAGSFKATKGVGNFVGGVNATLSPTQLQIYIVGDGTNNHTTFTSTASNANAFFLYAPQSSVTMKATSFAGALIGYDVTANTPLYTQDLGLNSYPLSSYAGVFRVTGYTQCPLKNTSGVAVTELSSTISSDTSGC